MTIEEAALRIAAVGIRVHLLRVKSKIPLFPDWPRLATTDPVTIRGWCAKRPRAGLGVATGKQPNGRVLIVVDLDAHNPAALGADTWADLLQSYGEEPETVCAITGGGGRHLWFWAPRSIRNDAGKLLGLGIDIRGDGGQVAVYPTIHPDTGTM